MSATQQSIAEQSDGVNCHYLDHVMAISAIHAVEANEDIVAADGMKLLAKGARIDETARSRLLEYKLCKPLENSITVGDAVQPHELSSLARQLLDDRTETARLAA
jgi:hypothetical protein